MIVYRCRPFIVLGFAIWTLVLYLFLPSVSDRIYNGSKWASRQAKETASIGNNQRKSPLVKDARSRIILYNRAPKCGSRSMLSVLGRLAQRNNFTEYTSQDYRNKRPKDTELPQQIKDIAILKPPIIYNRHLFYVDFRKYGYQQPIYINLIRDPIERFSSHYNYMKYGDETEKRGYPKSTWSDINVCILRDQVICKRNLPFYVGRFFCGMDSLCEIPSRKRLEYTKKILDEEYLLVGITEEFENTLRLFERLLPEYFDGALEIWKRHSFTKNSTASKKHDILSEESKEKLRNDILADEYELYNYAKEKFYRALIHYGIVKRSWSKRINFEAVRETKFVNAYPFPYDFFINNFAPLHPRLHFPKPILLSFHFGLIFGNLFIPSRWPARNQDWVLERVVPKYDVTLSIWRHDDSHNFDPALSLIVDECHLQVLLWNTPEAGKFCQFINEIAQFSKGHVIKKFQGGTVPPSRGPGQ